MVEGPGCTLNGEKIRSKVKTGQKVKEFRGTLTTSTRNNSGSNPFHRFSGCLYTGVETLGKELFMYFGIKAIRVHFGMNGSMRVNPTEKKARTGSPPVLEIHLCNDIVSFFDSTVEIRLTEDCQQKVRAGESLDVCSSKFSFSCSEQAVRCQSSRVLCDVLLDQAVMPGVGNIIKNEALFDSGLHPAVKVHQLTDEQIHHVVKMTRDFTLLFYKCRKYGSALGKHYKVYKRPQCGRCSHAITVCRLGDNGRMTYFCQRCQKGDPRGVDISKLPVRNGLSGWLHGDRNSDDVAKKEEEDWPCPLCTLINPPAAKACDACLSPRPEACKNIDGSEASPFIPDLIKFPCNSFEKPPEELKVNWRSAFGTSTLVFSDLSKKLKPVNSPLSSPAANRFNSSVADGGSCKNSVCRGTTSPSSASSSHPAKKMRIDQSPSNNAPNGTRNAGFLSERGTQEASPTSCSPSIPHCTSHNRPAVVKVVHKPGENTGRQFYSCSLSQARCNFFQWADLHFPLCHHGKRCVIRTVLKLGPNNGRNFYTCGFQKAKQCGFFQWSEN